MNKMLEQYCQNGFKVFPSQGKRPLVKNPFQVASSEVSQIESWIEKFGNCNWGLSLSASGLVAIDVDTKDGGLEKWKEYTDKYGEPDTLKAKSGGGGLHYVFKDGGLKFYNCFREGDDKISPVEAKHNGSIHVAPSIHASGNSYEWVDGFDASRVSVLPQWILKRIEKKKKPVKEIKIADSGLEISHIRELISLLKHQQLDHDEWVSCGMALFNEFPGAVGRALWTDLSLNGESYSEGDEELSEAKWQSFSEHSGGYTIGTIIHILKDRGVKIPIGVKKALVKKQYEQRVEGIDGWEYKNGSFYSGDRDFIVDHINKLGYCFIESNANAPFARIDYDDHGVPNLTTMRADALKHNLEHLFFIEQIENKTSSRIVEVPAVDIWRRHAKKRRYKRVTTAPTDDPNIFSLFTPILFEAIEGDVEPFLRDIVFKSICNSNEDRYQWLIKWFAYTYQFPSEKLSTIPFMISKKQGTGKGLLMYINGKMLGSRYLHIGSKNQLTKNFNKEQANKRLTFLDEMSFRNDHAQQDFIKNTTGRDTLNIEEKYGASYTVPNYSNYIGASNSVDAIPMDVGNRRFVPIDSSDRYAGKSSYFDKYWKQAKHGQLANNLYHYLLNVDVSDFVPHEVPVDLNSAVETKLKGGGSYAEFWDEVFSGQSDPILYRGEYLSWKETYESFKIYVKETKGIERNISSRSFRSKTTEMMPILAEKDRETRIWVTKFGQKKQIRVTQALAAEIYESFCETMQVPQSDDFNPTDLTKECNQ